MAKAEILDSNFIKQSSGRNKSNFLTHVFRILEPNSFATTIPVQILSPGKYYNYTLPENILEDVEKGTNLIYHYTATLKYGSALPN